VTSSCTLAPIIYQLFILVDTSLLSCFLPFFSLRHPHKKSKCIHNNLVDGIVMCYLEKVINVLQISLDTVLDGHLSCKERHLSKYPFSILILCQVQTLWQSFDFYIFSFSNRISLQYMLMIVFCSISVTLVRIHTDL